MTHFRAIHFFRATVLAAAFTLAAGCMKPAQKTESSATQANDSQLLADVNNKIAADQALSGQQIQAQVASGVAVLTGSVDSEAAKGLAAADAQQVAGIKTVVNNLSVNSSSTPVAAPAIATATPPPAPQPNRAAQDRNRIKSKHSPRNRRARNQSTPQNVPDTQPPPIQQAENQRPPQQPDNAPPSPQQAAAPAPPPPPISRTYTLPTGTVVPVRMIDSLETGVTQPNSSFRGSLAADLVEEGMVVVRQGATVVGHVIDAKDATHYTGNALLTLELTRINSTGQPLSIVTDPYTEQGKGRGSNTAKKVGGGAILGGIIGAIAGGGKGAAIGSVAGGGIGAGANTVTRGQQVSIPAETIVRFRLSAPLQVTTTSRNERVYDNGQPTLQPKPQ